MSLPATAVPTNQNIINDKKECVAEVSSTASDDNSSAARSRVTTTNTNTNTSTMEESSSVPPKIIAAEKDLQCQLASGQVCICTGCEDTRNTLLLKQQQQKRQFTLPNGITTTAAYTTTAAAAAAAAAASSRKKRVLVTASTGTMTTEKKNQKLASYGRGRGNQTRKNDGSMQNHSRKHWRRPQPGRTAQDTRSVGQSVAIHDSWIPTECSRFIERCRF